MPEPMVIDLSHWNEVDSFASLKDQGIVAVIFKATEGTSYVDPTLFSRFAAAQSCGLACCTYHFLKHGSVPAQMMHYLKTISPVDGERLVIDYEDEACTLDDLHQAVSELLEHGHNLQLTVYSGHTLKEQLGSKCDTLLSAHTSLWLAQYTTGQPSWPTGTWPHWSLWQYTDSGQCGGIAGNVDLNMFNGTRKNCVKWIGPAGEPVEEIPEAGEEPVVAITTSGKVRILVNGEEV